MKEILLPLGSPSAAGEKHTKWEKKRQPRHRFKHRDVNHGQASFAKGESPYKLVWIFLIGSFIGVVFEVIFVWATSGVLMRRSGMLYGPFNQVYGFGALMFTIFLYRFRKYNAFIIFLVSMILGLAFEYGCSWVQEVVFHSTSWDYSNMPLNIGGRTNLLYGVGWGLMGMIFINHTWPFLSEMVERIPNRIGKPLTIIVAVLLVLDMGISGLAVWRAGERNNGVPATNFMEQWMDKTYPNAVLEEKYPSMNFDPHSRTASEGFNANIRGRQQAEKAASTSEAVSSASIAAASGTPNSQSSP